MYQKSLGLVSATVKNKLIVLYHPIHRADLRANWGRYRYTEMIHLRAYYIIYNSTVFHICSLFQGPSGVVRNTNSRIPIIYNITYWPRRVEFRTEMLGAPQRMYIIRNNERRLFWHVRAPDGGFECVSMMGIILLISEHFRPPLALPTRTSRQVVSGASSTGSSS